MKSSYLTNILIAFVLAMRAVDLVSWLVAALRPYFPLYATMGIVILLGVLVLERNRLEELYVSRHRWRASLVGGLLGWPFGFFVGLALAWTRFGIHWLPWGEMLPTLGPALATGFFEELMFRSYLLSRLVRTRLSPGWANVVQTIFFVVVHPRFFVQGNLVMIVTATVFALGAGALVLRTRNIIGAMVAHAGWAFMVYIPIGGIVSFV